MLNTLFPNEVFPISGPPPVWFRRLVLIEHLQPTVAIIRDIEFHLGLNVICTKSPPADSTEAHGHDVGKTLLTRLLRYCLGEEEYAPASTRVAIRRAFPDSFVAAELQVAGQAWAVLRRLGAPATHEPCAGRVSSWRMLTQSGAGNATYAEFLNCVAGATLDGVESPLLTHKQRQVQWCDVLAWIARDQKCRYTHPLEWRHSDTDSGVPPLHQEDASTVLRSVTGLMSNRERKLFEEHDGLLRRRQALARERDTLKPAVAGEQAALDEDIREFLKQEDVPVNELALEILSSRRDRMTALFKEEIDRHNLPARRKSHEAAIQGRADSTATVSQLESASQTIDTQLRQRQQEKPPQSIYDAFVALCDRPTDDCPARLKIATTSLPDPYRAEEIARLKQELSSVKERLQAARGAARDAEDKVETERDALNAAETEVSRISTDLSGRIADYKTMLRRIERHLKRSNRLVTVAQDSKDLDDQVKRSSEEQRQLREALDQTRNWLGERYESICQRLLGPSRRFSVRVESKAVVLTSGGGGAAPGEATSTSALVLGLDLACMRSAMDGHGRHPRLLILDSPREADMELAIFHRLIRLLSGWHTANTPPTFQIIVTTTTRPVEHDLPPGTVCDELSRQPSTDLLFRREL